MRVVGESDKDDCNRDKDKSESDLGESEAEGKKMMKEKKQVKGAVWGCWCF